MTLPQRWLIGTVLVALALAALAIGVLTLLPSVALGSAIAVAERRPPLLADARWNDPASAQAFNARFAPGSASADLLGWLATNRFAIDQRTETARRQMASLPCNETVLVTWRERLSRLVRASALVREAGCL